MTTKLIKTSHYLTPVARTEIQSLAQGHARSAGWIVRKCVEYGLAHADQIDFHAPANVPQQDTEYKKAIDDFFGDQQV